MDFQSIKNSKSRVLYTVMQSFIYEIMIVLLSIGGCKKTGVEEIIK